MLKSNMFGSMAQDLFSKVLSSVQSGNLDIEVRPDIEHRHENRHGRISDHVYGSVTIRISFDVKEEKTQEK